MNIIKYLQAQGIDTRKGCQWLVKHGLVQINGETVPDDKADITPDSVQTLTIDGEDAVVIPLPYFYILLNKQRAVVLHVERNGTLEILATRYYGKPTDAEKEALQKMLQNDESK